MQNGSFYRFYWIAIKVIINPPKHNWKSAKNKVGVVLGQNLGQIRSNVVKKVKNRFFHILHVEYILKQEVVVAQTPEWKFKANIAKMPHFKDIRAKFN